MPVELNYVVGNVLRELRENAGLSQQALADISEVSRSFISQVERGNKSPTAKVLYKLSEHLNTSPASIFTTIDARLKLSNKYSWLRIYNL